MANIKDVNKLVAALAKERKKQGKTQTEIGDAIGITQTYLSQIETGVRVKFSTSLLLRYANALGKPLAIVLWQSCTEEDVPEEKREVYKSLKPSIDGLIDTVFGE